MKETNHFIIYYNDKIDSEYYGICKSISELYVSILRDKRIGISADLVKKYPEYAKDLLNLNKKDAIDRYNYYKKLSEMDS